MMKKTTNRQTIEGQLNTLIALHDRAIRVGWCAFSHIHSEPGTPLRADNSITVTGSVDNRGRYGLVPGIIIRSVVDGTPLASMTIERAYYYANLGGSIINTNEYFSILGYD